MHTALWHPAPNVYGAVLFLRRHDRTVYRRGRKHRVDDRLILSTTELLGLARCLGWRKGRKVELLRAAMEARP